MRALEEQGYVQGYAARLDPQRLGLGLQLFVEISLVSQSEGAMASFEQAVAGFDDILECHLMSGTADYLLRVVVADIAGYDLVYKKLIRSAELFDVSSSFAMEQIKFTTALPVSAA